MSVLRVEGVWGLFRGLLPTLLLTAPQSTIQFSLYHFLQNKVLLTAALPALSALPAAPHSAPAR